MPDGLIVALGIRHGRLLFWIPRLIISISDLAARDLSPPVGAIRNVHLHQRGQTVRRRQRHPHVRPDFAAHFDEEEILLRDIVLLMGLRIDSRQSRVAF